MANSTNPDQTAPSGFAYAILSDILVYEIRTFTTMTLQRSVPEVIMRCNELIEFMKGILSMMFVCLMYG